ncbi:MAG: carboxylating nicotinate-nucleotide diphosphorylase [Candidatus Polarisedimenticolia bacterium]|nr:carboxylating nicotinate-nucleotide diphosphorylase [bacterium]
MSAFPEDAARELLRRALDEDLGAGDVTTRALVPATGRARAVVVAREELVVCGLPFGRLTMDEMAARGEGAVAAAVLAQEGTTVAAGTPLLRLDGAARAILSGERTLLNIVSRLSGVATLTARCVAEIAGTKATIADTRKTTPGLRLLEKYAVACGGGENHRIGLFDLVLVKDNHKQFVGGMKEVVLGLRRAGHDLARVELEVDSLEEFDVALAAGAGFILLDNFTPEMVREAARRRAGARTKLEASGGLRAGNLRAYAEAGVDRLSLGSLTHGARAVDVALDFEAAP